MTAKEKNEFLEGKVFKNSRGNYVHLKFDNDHRYLRGERKFAMCEAETRDEAIDRPSGPGTFTSNIMSALRRGKLMEVK